ncbi:hypothetical protein A3Q56_00909 [Intoshia linei]|uniref:HTH psq-type domain-containing protein n=1 Tax=Intoshia linei TaxID=1819745 RepID=A0A177BAW6_9BILA|nr:hypothetical protein A3Q56_00909 [Intoshia linei]
MHLNVSQKIEILNQIDNGMKPFQISLQYGVSRGIIYYIKKNRMKLNDSLKYLYSRTKTCKNLISCSFPKMEEALFY